ncbi:hypothetical protein CDAR_316661 [Caerostris darwini]|uniref:Uncharacterized protein n=1 Tax=Caerostris darwini TaxID=1538125 RepID=A0AAV4UJB1_9ARAC|nr:hypothetical protein CDAR_316661 [Caerostris darwini]
MLDRLLRILEGGLRNRWERAIVSSLRHTRNFHSATATMFLNESGFRAALEKTPVSSERGGFVTMGTQDGDDISSHESHLMPNWCQGWTCYPLSGGGHTILAGANEIRLIFARFLMDLVIHLLEGLTNPLIDNIELNPSSIYQHRLMAINTSGLKLPFHVVVWSIRFIMLTDLAKEIEHNCLQLCGMFPADGWSVALSYIVDGCNDRGEKNPTLNGRFISFVYRRTFFFIT